MALQVAAHASSEVASVLQRPPPAPLATRASQPIGVKARATDARRCPGTSPEPAMCIRRRARSQSALAKRATSRAEDVAREGARAQRARRPPRSPSRARTHRARSGSASRRGRCAGVGWSRTLPQAYSVQVRARRRDGRRARAGRAPAARSRPRRQRVRDVRLSTHGRSPEARRWRLHGGEGGARADDGDVALDADRAAKCASVLHDARTHATPPLAFAHRDDQVCARRCEARAGPPPSPASRPARGRGSVPRSERPRASGSPRPKVEKAAALLTRSPQL